MITSHCSGNIAIDDPTGKRWSNYRGWLDYLPGRVIPNQLTTIFLVFGYRSVVALTTCLTKDAILNYWYFAELGAGFEVKF